MRRSFQILWGLVLGILALAGTAKGADRKVKGWMSPDDPYVAFVKGQPLLVAATGGRTVLLSLPDLKLVRTLEGAAEEQRLLLARSSPDGAWIAGFIARPGLFGMKGHYRGEGTLQVWNTATGESRLVLKDASMAFDFNAAGDRLIMWQQQGGIGQWTLADGKQAGSAITSADRVDDLRVSNDGLYLLVKGRCHAENANWDFCLYRLEDGSATAWTRAVKNDETWKTKWAGPKTIPMEDYEEFDEVVDSVDAVDILPCAHSRKGRLLCSDAGTVMLALPAKSKDQRIAGFPVSRVIWTIRGGEDVGRFINSCALDPDGRFVAVGADGENVLLFDSRHLESNGNLILGNWMQPAFVKRFAMH